MTGAIAGDIAGFVYESHRIETKEFGLFSPGCSFTDDSVLTTAMRTGPAFFIDRKFFLCKDLF